jgi:acetolactate synthase I/II/III large subunit
MNIQEFQTIAAYNLPIKIFVLNNDGYLAIRLTQDTYFQGRHYGSDPSGGLCLPRLMNIARAYGLPATCAKTGDELDHVLTEVLSSPGPYLCELIMDPKQSLYPKLSSVMKPDGSMVSMPLEDMYPFLPRDEFARHMLIPLLEQSKELKG